MPFNFLRNGGNTFALQALMGHADLNTLNTYIKLAKVDLQQEQAKASVAAKWKLK